MYLFGFMTAGPDGPKRIHSYLALSGVRVGMSITQNYRDSNEIIGLSVSFSSDDQQAVKCKVCIVLSSILK